MGLDAFVRCNCYKEGKTKPFPLPELEKYFDIDVEAYPYLELDEKEYKDAHRQVIQWEYDACEHKDMQYVFLRVGNWSGYSYFQQALEDIGWSYFPTLFAELPGTNGGFTTADKAKIMLKELILFRKLASGREMPFLVNTASNAVIYNYVAAQEGVFMWAGKEKFALGIDPDGFFIAKILLEENAPLQQPAVDKSQILFRSMRFEQRLMDFNEHGVPQKVEYFDANTEERFVCETPVMLMRQDEEGNLQRDYPRLLHVETRQIDASEYDYQLNALETLSKASIETGNPIVWC